MGSVHARFTSECMRLAPKRKNKMTQPVHAIPTSADSSLHGEY